MSRSGYLFDTHALYFWRHKSHVSQEFIDFFDARSREGALLASSVSFWELALLIQKGRLKTDNLHRWKDEILENSAIRLVEPTVAEMIDSVALPSHHRDPFDRLLITQAQSHDACLVTRDRLLTAYPVEIFWI